MATAILTAARLRELFSYNPEDGLFTRIKSICPAGKVGVTVNYLDKSTGYIKVTVDGKQYYAHRLAWLYSFGEWPAQMVDHIDMDRTNNRLVNLRAANKALNMQNQKKPLRSNRSGFLGVSPGKRPGLWRATIVVDNRQHHLGAYDTPEEAHEAYIAAKRRLHPGCTI